MSFYLDASFLVSLLVEEAHTPAADKWWLSNSDDVIISAFAAAEVACALSRGVRTGRFAPEQARGVLEDLDALRIRATGFVPSVEAFAQAEALVRDFATRLTAPDALHLASAIEAGAALVSFDERLAQAARVFSGDAIVPPL